MLSNEILEKLNSEINETNNLLDKVKKLKYFNDLNKQNLWKLDQYGVPRLESWNTLLNNSKLETNVFLIPYKLYSNYAHSEFISLIQLNGSRILHKDSSDNQMHLKNALRIVNMINCVSIIELKNKYFYSSEIYEKLDSLTKEKIEFWNDFATGKHNH